MRDLHDHFDGLFGDEPGQPPVDVHLASGHRALRRRRLTTGVGALAVLAIIGGTGYAVAARPSGDAPTDNGTVASQAPESTPPDPDRRLIDACHRTEGNDDAVTYLWRGGEPEVMAAEVSWTGNASAYLRAGDGRTWGECFIDEGSSKGFLLPARRIAPDPRLSSLGGGYGIGQACDPDGVANADVDQSCRRFAASQGGRRDPEVARVEARFFDGKWERVETNEGYYYLEHVGTLPADLTWDNDGMPVRNGQGVDDVINRMKLFDADGNLIAYWDASQNRQGINASNGKGVGDLEDYPLIQSKLAGPEGDKDFP